MARPARVALVLSLVASARAYRIEDTSEYETCVREPSECTGL